MEKLSLALNLVLRGLRVGEDNTPIASGAHDWENRLEDGIWTYTLDDIWTGLADSYTKMTEDVRTQYGVEVTKLAAIGFSAMMHGYMVFDQAGELLVPFRTWRNTITGQASEQLTELFQYHIPQRWSIAHLDQAILNGEEHVAKIDYLVTLAGYIHWQLTGEKVLGVGEASGMFPIDIAACDFNERMIGQFDERVAAKGYPWKLRGILPKVLSAGEAADGRRREAPGRIRQITGRRSGLPAGRRRWDRYGCYEQRSSADRQCISRHLCIWYGRYGKRVVQSI